MDHPLQLPHAKHQGRPHQQSLDEGILLNCDKMWMDRITITTIRFEKGLQLSIIMEPCFSNLENTLLLFFVISMSFLLHSPSMSNGHLLKNISNLNYSIYFTLPAETRVSNPSFHQKLTCICHQIFKGLPTILRDTCSSFAKFYHNVTTYL